MARKIFTVLLFSLLFIAVSSAQEIKKTGGFTRLESMGNNPYILDPYFNTVNPAWNAVYDNFILLDLGSVSGAPFSAGGFGQYLSTSFRLSKNWTIGGILARNDFFGMSIALVDPATNYGTPVPGVVSTVNSIVGSGAVVPMDNNIVLMGTFTTGNTSLGLGVAFTTTTNDINPPTGGSISGSASQIGFNLGVLTNLSRSIKLDVGASLILPSASFQPSTGSETNASQTIIFVNGRAFWNLNTNLTFVPLIGFFTASGSADSGGTSSASFDLQSFTTFGFGAGLNYQLGDFLIAGGALFATGNLTTPAVNGISPELSTSGHVFPVWNFGVEWNMLEWFVGRVGYTAYTGNVSTESAASSTTITESIVTFFHPTQRGATLGVGLRFGDFSLDATVNEDVLRQGFNIIGGGSPTFVLLTSSYALP
ncbi:MAG: hypothetical protein ACW98D_17410 [Promethearchaeota archaeon]|jgi:hypothetical protein